MSKTKRLVIDALLIALFFVLSAAAVTIGGIKLTFASLPGILAAMLYGPIDGFVVGFLGAFLEQMLHFAKTHLTPQQQCIFKMRFLGGMKYGEIGEELGISRVAVWKHLSNITKMIKEQFKDSEL